MNPNIDAGGISADQFHDDPEFAEAYFRGDYDQTCNHCAGLRVVEVADFDAMSQEDRAAYLAQQKDDAALAWEMAMEARMGC